MRRPAAAQVHPAGSADLAAIRYDAGRRSAAEHPIVAPLLRSGFRICDYDIAMSTADLTLPTTWAYPPGLA
ncbi:MAG TPA: hypothetical protein VFE19_09185 [Jatrophihabitantaceae bacterium]|nr:hypothetical protein [Jatrophihabitantaceae bacterium]